MIELPPFPWLLLPTATASPRLATTSLALLLSLLFWRWHKKKSWWPYDGGASYDHLFFSCLFFSLSSRTSFIFFILSHAPSSGGRIRWKRPHSANLKITNVSRAIMYQPFRSLLSLTPGILQKNARGQSLQFAKRSFTDIRPYKSSLLVQDVPHVPGPSSILHVPLDLSSASRILAV